MNGRIFPNFKIWYDEHYIPGNAIDLDKDLLCNEANIYSPETYAFLSHYLKIRYLRTEKHPIPL